MEHLNGAVQRKGGHRGLELRREVWARDRFGSHCELWVRWGLWRAGREEGQSQETRINIEGADRGRGWKGDWAGMVGKPEENKIKSGESSKRRSTVSEARKRPCSHWIQQQTSQWSLGNSLPLGSFLHSHTLIIPLQQKISHLHFKPSPICMESICGSGKEKKRRCYPKTAMSYLKKQIASQTWETLCKHKDHNEVLSLNPTQHQQFLLIFILIPFHRQSSSSSVLPV